MHTTITTRPTAQTVNLPAAPEAVVAQIMARRFGPQAAGNPRSREYQAGVHAALQRAAHGTTVRCPYAAGVASFDAFWAGVDEGNTLWRQASQQVAFDLAASARLHG